MTAAFRSLASPGNADVQLTSATSPVAGLMQLHEMATQDGTIGSAVLALPPGFLAASWQGRKLLG